MEKCSRPIGKTIRVHRWGLMIAAGRRRCAYVLPPGTPRRQAEAARLDLLRRGVDQDQLTLFVLGAPAVGACLIAVLGLTMPAVLLAIPLPALLQVVWASRHSVVDRARVVAVEVHATSRSWPDIPGFDTSLRPETAASIIQELDRCAVAARQGRLPEEAWQREWARAWSLLDPGQPPLRLVADTCV